MDAVRDPRRGEQNRCLAAQWPPGPAHLRRLAERLQRPKRTISVGAGSTFGLLGQGSYPAEAGTALRAARPSEECSRSEGPSPSSTRCLMGPAPDPPPPGIEGKLGPGYGEPRDGGDQLRRVFACSGGADSAKNDISEHFLELLGNPVVGWNGRPHHRPFEHGRGLREE